MIKTIAIIILSVTFFGILFFILVRNALKRKLDTLVEEDIPSPNCDWMGYSNLENERQYRSLILKDQLVFDICEKEATDKNSFPYIGLAGINNTEEFWYQMIKGKEEAIKIGESYGLKNLIKKIPIQSIPFTWNDTGNIESLKKASQ